MQKRSILLRFSKDFQKDLVRLNETQKKQFEKRLELFQKHPDHLSLRNHKLRGKMAGFYSINISGDMRAIYEILGKGVNGIIIGFTRLGTHSQLY